MPLVIINTTPNGNRAPYSSLLAWNLHLHIELLVKIFGAILYYFDVFFFFFIIITLGHLKINRTLIAVLCFLAIDNLLN